MAPKGQKGANARFYEQLLFWVAMNNIGIKILIKEGYKVGKSIGNGNAQDRWPIEIYRCGVCELPKPTGTVQVHWFIKQKELNKNSGVDRMFMSPHSCIPDGCGLGFRVGPSDGFGSSTDSLHKRLVKQIRCICLIFSVDDKIQQKL